MEVRPQGSILRIRGLYPSLKPAERRLADYILENPNEIANITMEELERRSESSYATIYRFCRKLGFSGFKQLKQAIVADILGASSGPTTIDDMLIHPSMSMSDVASRVFAFSRQILDDCESMLDLDQMEAAVERLVGARQVLFVGSGTSGVSATYAYTKFFRLGIDCQVQSDPVLAKMKAGILGSEDVLFAISSSGRTRHAIDAATLAKKRGATIIALTDYAVSPLSKLADVNLYTTPRNVNHHLELEMPLLIGQITLIDVLQMCCISRLPEEAVEHYRTTKEAADLEKR